MGAWKGAGVSPTASVLGSEPTGLPAPSLAAWTQLPPLLSVRGRENEDNRAHSSFLAAMPGVGLRVSERPGVTHTWQVVWWEKAVALTPRRRSSSWGHQHLPLGVSLGCPVQWKQDVSYGRDLKCSSHHVRKSLKQLVKLISVMFYLKYQGNMYSI